MHNVHTSRSHDNKTTNNPPAPTVRVPTIGSAATFGCGFSVHHADPTCRNHYITDHRLSCLASSSRPPPGRLSHVATYFPGCTYRVYLLFATSSIFCATQKLEDQTKNIETPKYVQIVTTFVESRRNATTNTQTRAHAHTHAAQ